jgi:hypothetical protein
MQLSTRIKARVPKKVKHVVRMPEQTWRSLTFERRALPSFIILGAQRSGTTSLYEWLCTHPAFDAPWQKELHYFDVEYERGMRWYRSYFPRERPGKITGEASPYMLPHPLAPERVARDLPASTKFIVQLREPVERAISHYFLERVLGCEPEVLERALELEEERLAGSEEILAAGLRHYNHRHFSYTTRGQYAPQLRRWFDVIGRERILILESERLLIDSTVQTEVLDWLGLPPNRTPMPSVNAARRTEGTSEAAVARLVQHFKPYNEDLFELLGTRMWEDTTY